MSNIQGRGLLHGVLSRGGGGGVTDYNQLSSKPQINDVTIEGNHDGGYYGLIDSADIEVTEIYEIGYGSNYDINLNGASVHVTNKIFKGATNSANGAKGLVPAPAAGSVGKILSNEGWVDPPSTLSDYSTTAHKTGRKWIDGKDVWEQSFTGTLTSASQTLILGDLDYIPDTIITQIGQALYAPTHQWLTLPYVYPSNSTTVALLNVNGSQRVVTANFSQYTTVVVTTEFTRAD